MKNDYAIDFTDDDGKRYVWERKSYEEHASYREELKDKTFIERIKKAIKETDVKIKSHINHFICFYYKEYEIGTITRYTKVIVDMKGNINYIKSAYRPDKIKELQYNKPLWTRN